MKDLSKNLKAVTRELKALSKKTDSMAKSLGKTPTKRVASVKRRKAISKSSLPSSRISSSTDQALKVIKRHKKGIDVATLKKKTGFDDKKISNIVHRAFKKGIITRVGRGLYRSV